jgi:hypothetical protein
MSASLSVNYSSRPFTLLALLTLALGIGLNTAIFSLINDLFLRGLPFKEPGRVVHMYSNARERNLLELAVSVPRFQHFRASQKIFDGFEGENIIPFTLTALGDAVQLFGGKVTSNYFDVLGVQPIRGRNFLLEEEEAADVAMVTENFWQKRMGGDPNVIGRSITLEGVPHTIVGVLPNLPFSWIGPNAEIWTTKPFVVPGLSYERIMRGSGFLRRRANGARRANERHLTAGGEPGNAAGGFRIGGGIGCSVGARSFDRFPTLQTSAHNPLLLAATISILGFVALLACVFPARRAAMLDPVQAVRTE